MKQNRYPKNFFSQFAVLFYLSLSMTSIGYAQTPTSDPSVEQTDTCVIFSPDGRTLVSCSALESNIIRLWEVDTGKVKALLRGHTGNIWTVIFSPDGRTLASCSEDKTIRLWDVDTLQIKMVLAGHTDTVYKICFSPNGKTLASASEDKTLRLWNVNTGVELAVLRGHNDLVAIISFSPDGRTLYSASADKTIRLWDVESSKQTKMRAIADKDSSGIGRFSPDGKTLAIASKDNIRLWDVGTGKGKAVLKGHTDHAWSIRFSPDGKTLASASADNTLRLWDLRTAKGKAVLQGHTKDVYGVEFSPDGKTLASASEDDSIRLWDVGTGKEKAVLKVRTDTKQQSVAQPTLPEVAKPGDIWKDPITGIEFVWVPGGTFQMGSPDNEKGRSAAEGPVHQVQLDGFWLGKFEVTRGQFKKFVEVTGYKTEAERDGGANGYYSEDTWVEKRGWNWRNPGFDQDDTHPVVSVSWNDAKAMADWLSQQGNGSFGFPSEAQWEYAARSGGKEELYAGGGDVDAVAWYNKNSDKSTHPVGKKSPNGLGLYDMSGNAMEWCADIYSYKAYKRHQSRNPIYMTGGGSQDRVYRGGSWGNLPENMRCTKRYSSDPSSRYNNVGFRLSKTP